MTSQDGLHQNYPEPALFGFWTSKGRQKSAQKLLKSAVERGLNLPKVK